MERSVGRFDGLVLLDHWFPFGQHEFHLRGGRLVRGYFYELPQKTFFVGENVFFLHPRME